MVDPRVAHQLSEAQYRAPQQASHPLPSLKIEDLEKATSCSRFGGADVCLIEAQGFVGE
jgi:hypothetical protein